ncbi:MAG: hypothetical protein U5K28_03475 [Halobacteriales archaeon]|nr:hypothetical protein [Halobacteriales archaeon]
MEMTDNPYEYGDEQMDSGLEGAAPEGCENGGDAVIVDGDAISYRSYQARNGG